jgi:hypothetical protein
MTYYNIIIFSMPVVVMDVYPSVCPAVPSSITVTRIKIKELRKLTMVYFLLKYNELFIYDELIK